MQSILTLKIGGAAGQGVKSSGQLFAKYAARSGKHIYNYVEYPSIIKGGHNVIQVNVSNEEVLGPSNKTDLLVALNQETINLHLNELTPKSCIIFDGDKKLKTENVNPNVKLCPIPLAKLAEEAGGKEILINMVALGAAAGLLSGNLILLQKFVREQFEHKGESIVLADLKAAELGYNYALSNYANIQKSTLSPETSIASLKENMIVNGNEAVALGAISAGLQFAAIYPMSPISNILHVLAEHQEEYGYVYKQPEDEISAINMALGASFAGARAMTATSGGGFCLMSEGYGLAGITETPIVIVEGMRGGPATGLPTWSAQDDLRFVIHAHQGEFPKIILTPGDAQEVFDTTMKAFNLAEKYQTPVVILIDKNLCENDQSVPMFDPTNYKTDRGKLVLEKIENFERYKLESDGISQRSVPGSGNFFIANSDEHDLQGLSNEEIKNRNEQMKKRMQKLVTCAEQDMQDPTLYGPEKADITLVSWGSNKGSILQAIKNYKNVNYLHITWANPFPVEKVKQVLNNAKHVVNIECNYSAQMGGWIKQQTSVEIKDNMLKYDGRPFYVEDIQNKIESLLKG
ncbi:MAG: 2-oxoacid:acceptor oxidoreductase subunit alpha [Patescibacteria group bacterium]